VPGKYQHLEDDDMTLQKLCVKLLNGINELEQELVSKRAQVLILEDEAQRIRMLMFAYKSRCVSYEGKYGPIVGSVAVYEEAITKETADDNAAS
jgi:hypothetical protein